GGWVRPVSIMGVGAGLAQRGSVCDCQGGRHEPPRGDGRTAKGRGTNRQDAKSAKGRREGERGERARGERDQEKQRAYRWWKGRGGLQACATVRAGLLGAEAGGRRFGYNPWVWRHAGRAVSVRERRCREVGMIQAARESSSADGVSWDLGDLYGGAEDPR